MAAFLGMSLWISLSTIAPGLTTIALVYCSLMVTAPTCLLQFNNGLKNLNDWVVAGLAITVMVLTQLLGILLERALTRYHWLGPTQREVEIPTGIDPLGTTHFTVKPYAEYQGLYLLLAELREHEDSQGHLQRMFAQFFLTNNILVSFAVGVVVAAVALVMNPQPSLTVGLIYIVGLIICMVVVYSVERIRFDVMARAMWATRRRRLQSELAPSLPQRSPNT